MPLQFIHQVHDPAAGHFRPSSNNHNSTVLATTSATIRTHHFVVLRRSSNTACCTNFANSTGSNQSTIIVDAVTVAEFSTVTTRWINRAFTVRDSSAFVLLRTMVVCGLVMVCWARFTTSGQFYRRVFGLKLVGVCGLWFGDNCTTCLYGALSDFVDWYFLHSLLQV